MVQYVELLLAIPASHMICVLDALLLIQLSACVSVKAAEGPSTWVLVNQVGGSDGVPGSCLWLGSTLAVVDLWE